VPYPDKDARFHAYLDGKLDTTDGQFPRSFGIAPGMLGKNGMHTAYWVLPESERLQGFVRPYSQVYLHEACGTRTQMGRAIAETMARDPSFYGATYCLACGGHFPIGWHGEFRWVIDGEATERKVGT
jgi:hypothetical protein